MKHIEGIVTRYWNNQLSAEELRDLLLLFQQEQEEWQVFLFKEYFNDIHRIDEEQSYLLREKRILEVLQQKIIGDKKIIKRPVKRIWLKPVTGWAAAVLLLLGLWAIIPNNTEVSVAARIWGHQQTVGEVGDGWHANAGETPKDITIVDGSVISLAPGSNIFVQLQENKRMVYLFGKATFNVQKDTARPFTVYANNIATTALGTIFTVDGRQESYRLKVQLLEGKVMLQAAIAAMANAPVLLHPGEQCQIDLQQNEVVVSLINPVVVKKLITVTETPAIDSLPLPEVEEEMSTSLTFDKVLLKDVLKRLSYIFNTKILFEEEVVREMLFTGSFEEEYTLLQILQVITTMNGLGVELREDGYNVFKPAIEEHVDPQYDDN